MGVTNHLLNGMILQVVNYFAPLDSSLLEVCTAFFIGRRHTTEAIAVYVVEIIVCSAAAVLVLKKKVVSPKKTGT